VKAYVWLAIIFLVALTVRVFGLSSYPIGFTPDEAAFGYNAYSLLNTGRDEWGVAFYKLPFTNLESFGDYKLPFYAFLAVPAVKLFGLNEFATRLPNAIIGSLAVLAVFSLARKLFSLKIALLAAFLMSISPWSISLSRGAFEANLITLFLPFSLALLFYHKHYLALIFLALNFYTYHSARYLSLIVSPLLIFKSKARFLSFLLLFILILPGFISLVGSGSSRTADVSILAPTDNWNSVSDSRFKAVQSGLPDYLARIFYNKVNYLISQFSRNYFSYFSPEFLFTNGVGETTYGMFPGIGVLHLIEIFSLSAFLVYLIKSHSKNLFLILFFLMLMPLPAALAKGVGYAGNRAVGMIPFYAIASAVGAVYLFKSKNLFLVFLTFVIISSVSFGVLYLYHSRDLASGMLFGRKEAIVRVANLSKDYRQVFVSRSLSEPHIFVAFYSQLDPTIYQSQSPAWQAFHLQKLKFLDQYDGYSLGKYTFGSLKFVDDKSLYVGLPQDFPERIKPMFTIEYPDSSPAIFVSSQ